MGDAVKAGDILAVITNADLDDTITDLEFDLWELDDQILSTSAGSKVTTIEAPAAGRVVAIYAEAAMMRWRFSAERAHSPSSRPTAE